MKTIYLDSEYRCRTAEDGTVTSVETDYFNGKCDSYIEGYRMIPAGESWTRFDGAVFRGEMVAPWQPYSHLDSVQREYERALIEDMESALNTLGVTLDE